MIKPLPFHKRTFLKAICIATLLICGINSVNAQQAFLAAGGNATGAGGSASYSVGQAVYMYNSGSNGSQTQGVQQSAAAPVAPTLSYGNAYTFALDQPISPVTPVSANVGALGYNSPAAIGKSIGSGFVKAVVDSAGNTYIISSSKTTIQVIPANGAATYEIGGPFNSPKGLAIGKAGDLYVAERTALYKVVPATGTTTQVTDISLTSATSMAADDYGNLYIADRRRIYKHEIGTSNYAEIDPRIAGVVNLAVKGNTLFYSAQISTDQAIIRMDLDGGNRRVVSRPDGFAIDGDLTGHIYGGGLNDISRYDGDDGLILNVGAAYNLSTDKKGNIYYAATQDSLVKKLTPSGGYFIDKPLPPGVALNAATGIISGTPQVVSPAATYTITAYSGTESVVSSFTLATVVNNRDLSALTVSGTTIGDSFNADTLSYKAVTAASLDSVTITPTAAAAGSTITCNGITVASGSAINVPVVTGANTITLVVTSEFGTSKTYTLNIKRGVRVSLDYGPAQTFTVNKAITAITPTAANVLPWGYNNPRTQLRSDFLTGTYLKALTDSAGTTYVVWQNLHPDDQTRNYITAIPADGGATYNVGGPFNYISAAIMDKDGNLYVGIVGGDIYKVVPSTNTKTRLPFSISNPQIRALALDDNGRLYIGDGSNGLYILDQSTGITTKVEGTKAINTIAIYDNYIFYNDFGVLYRSELNGNNKVLITAPGSQLQISFFDPAGYYYGQQVFVSRLGKKEYALDPNRDQVIKGLIKVEDTFNFTVGSTFYDGTTRIGENATIDGKGRFLSGVRGEQNSAFIFRDIPSGGYYIDKRLPPGMDFDAETGIISGTPTKTWPKTNYHITAYNEQENAVSTFTLAVKNDLTLTNLVTDAGSLTPAFSADTLNYRDTVAANVESIHITPTAANGGVTIVVAGEEVSSGSSSSAIDLYQGDNEIEVIVKAVNDTTSTTYKVNVYRTPSQPVIDYGGHTFTFKAGEQNGIAPTSENVEDVGYYDRGSVIGQRYTSPKGIGVDGHGNIFVADDASKNIYRISTTGDTTVYASGLPSPTAVAADGKGNIYVANTNGSVQKVSTGGSMSNIATGLGQLKGIAVSRAGNVYVTDYTNNKVLKISESGAPVEIGSGFVQPKGIAIDSLGFIYVVNGSSNSMKLMFQDSLLGDYSALTAPSAVAANASGTAYIVDEGKINTYLPIMGAAQPFNYPTENIEAVASDSAGNVYATSITTGRAYKFKPLGGYFISPALPEGMFFDSYSGSIIALLAKPTPAKQYVVTAYNNGLLARDTLTIGVEASADLYDVVLSAGTLSPCFCSGELNYTASVDNDVDTLRITPIPQDPNATIKINGMPTSYTAGLLDTLNIGDNIYSIVVTSQDSSVTKTYTITVNRAVSPDTLLSNLTLSAGTISPAFQSGVQKITASVPYTVTSIKVTPTVQTAISTVTVNGVEVVSGNPSGDIPLNYGENNIAVVVTAPDGLSKGNYVLTITRPLSDNAVLSLKLNNTNSQLISYSGASNKNYNTSVDADITSVTFTPTLLDANAVLRMNGDVITSGISTAPVMLTSGVTNVMFSVTAANGSTTKTYSVNIRRQGSNNAVISMKLTPSSPLISTTGAAGSNYTTSVDPGVTSVTLTPTAQDANAVIRLNGDVVQSGVVSAPIQLTADLTVLNVSVTAQDGTTIRTYSITVNRNGSNNAIMSLKLNPASPLVSTSGSSSVNYVTSVDPAVSSVTFTPTLQEPNAVITMNGSIVQNGVPTPAVNLAMGATDVNFVVTAQDGVTVKTYSVTVNRNGSNNAVALLKLTPASTLVSTTGSSDYNYATSVDAATSSVAITATAVDANAVIRLNSNVIQSGVASAPIPLAVGTTLIHLTVTAQDGVTVKTYTVSVTRAGSNNAIATFKLTPTSPLVSTGGSSSSNYVTSVDPGVGSVIITPTAQDANATVIINGTAVQSGVASGPVMLNAGSTVINIKVTAQDGITMRTYAITVLHNGSNNAVMSLKMLPPSLLTSTSGPASANYLTSVDANTPSVIFVPTAQDANAVIRLNGDVVTSGQPTNPVILDAGTTVVNFAVTAQDGVTVRTYTVTINRNGSNNANAVIRLNPGVALTKSTGAASINYAASVGAAVTSIQVKAITQNASSIMINGASVANDTFSGSIPLAEGNNIIDVTVTAQDGVTVQTYAVVVNRASSLLAVSKNDRDMFANNSKNNISATDNVVVHPAVSPNGDGSNDFLIIEGLSDHPGSRLAIMNTTGTLVFESKDYGKDGANMFDGHSKTGVQLKPGTYYYQLEYKVGNEDKRKTGFIILKY